MQYKVESKVYMAPSKQEGKVRIGLFVASAVFSVYSLFSIAIGEITPIAVVSLPAGIGLFIIAKKGKKDSPVYAFCFADVTLDDSSLSLCHKEKNREAVFQKGSIRSLEYSDQLKCLRFVGNYHEKTPAASGDKTDAEYLFYFDADKEPELLNAVATFANLTVKFMDR